MVRDHSVSSDLLNSAVPHSTSEPDAGNYSELQDRGGIPNSLRRALVIQVFQNSVGLRGRGVVTFASTPIL